MNKLLPIVLVIGGIAIAAIAYFGFQASNRPSDVELIQQAIFDQQDAAEALALALAQQGKQPLEVPDECHQVGAGIVFELCELEPDEGQPAPDWTQSASDTERACIDAALHRTNELAFRLQQREDAPAEPSSLSVIFFACDVASAAIFTEGVGWGDTDAPVAALLTTFFEDRSKSHYGPRTSY